MTLIGHTIARRVSEDAVRAIPEPAFTRTWFPIKHSRILDALADAVVGAGLQIQDRKYSMNQNGTDMFGVWRLSESANGIQWALGMRNSMAKRFAVGICAGNYVTVCDNMVFAGDFIEFRKHTIHIIRDLPDLSMRAVEGAVKKIGKFTDWHMGLKEHTVKVDDFKVLTFHAMERNVFAPSRFRNFLDCHEEENLVSPNNSETLYAFHGATTRLLREDNLFQIAKSTDELNKLCDEYIEMIEIPEKMGLFEAIKKRLSGGRS